MTAGQFVSAADITAGNLVFTPAANANGAALLLVIASVLAGLDPVTQVFAWFVGISSVGIIALMTLTSVAVVVYFRRSRVDIRTWHTLIAPGLGLAGLAVLLVMTAINLPLLVGGSSTTAAVIGVLLVGTFAGGAVLAALRPRAGRPSTEKEYSR